MTTQMLPGMFTATCNYWPRSKPPYATEPCNYTTTHRPDFEEHMRAHGRKPHTLTPVWARPNQGLWRGPRFVSDAKRDEALADVTERAQTFTYLDLYERVGDSYDTAWTVGEGQYWCDAYRNTVWVVPLTPPSDGALLVRLERIKHPHETGQKWRRAGAWGAPRT